MTIKTQSNTVAVSAGQVVNGSTSQVGSTAGAVAGPPTGAGSGSGSGSAGAAPPTRVPKGFRLELQLMLAGVQSAFPSGTSLAIAGAQTTQVSIVQNLQAALALYAAVDGQESGLAAARADLKTALPGERALYTSLKTALIAFFGKSSPQLKRFGIQLKQRAPATPAQKLIAAEKAKQTRTLRHTQGPKQKAALQFQGQVGISTQVNPQASAGTGEGTSASSTPAGSTSVAGTGGVPSAPPAPVAAVATPTKS